MTAREIADYQRAVRQVGLLTNVHASYSETKITDSGFKSLMNRLEFTTRRFNIHVHSFTLGTEEKLVF